MSEFSQLFPDFHNDPSIGYIMKLSCRDCKQNNNLYTLNYSNYISVSAVHNGSYTFTGNGVFSVFVRNLSSSSMSSSYFFARSDKTRDWRIMCNVSPDCYDSGEIIVNQGEKLTFSIANLSEVKCKFIPFTR